MLSGTLRTGGGPVPVAGRVRGEEISFKAGGREYRGRFSGGKLELQVGLPAPPLRPRHRGLATFTLLG